MARVAAEATRGRRSMLMVLALGMCLLPRFGFAESSRTILAFVFREERIGTLSAEAFCGVGMRRSEAEGRSPQAIAKRCPSTRARATRIGVP